MQNRSKRKGGGREKEQQNQDYEAAVEWYREAGLQWRSAQQSPQLAADPTGTEELKREKEKKRKEERIEERLY